MKRYVVLWTMLICVSACSTVNSLVPGYLTDAKGAILHGGDGRCWRTVEWRPSLAREECDPDVVREERARQQQRAVVVTPPAPVAAPVLEQPAQPASANAAVAVAEPVAQEREEVVMAPLTLNADTAFRFGDDTLSSEGRLAVIEMAGLIQMRKVKDLRVLVTGHTDRVGSEKANRDLSRRRAMAVKKVLVDGGVPAGAIEVVGKGASQPVTQREDCPDRLVKCELIDCLRKDRRVEVQVRGTVEGGRRRLRSPG